MTNAEVFSALKNGTMVYTGNEIKIPDLKKLVSAATIKASADNANSQKENKNFGVFDSIKEFTNLSDQSFGQLIKLIGKEQNESIFPVQGNYLLERRKNSILRAYKMILLEGHSKEQNYVEREIDRIGVENITNNVDIQMILCGNKYDLIIDDSNNRAVQIEEIEEYVKSLHNCKYFDISCKTAYNVDKVIQVVNELEVQSNEDETEEVKEKEKKSCVIF